MKTVIVVVVVAVMVLQLVAATTPNLQLDTHWEMYKKTYGKVYQSKDEEQNRQVFYHNKKL